MGVDSNSFEETIKELSIYSEGDIKFYSYEPKDYAPHGSALTKSMPVFYNPKMIINRDITLLAYRAFYEEYKLKYPDRTIKICDSMAASGIRSLRLLKFLPDDVKIIANDLNGLALRLIQANAGLNNIPDRLQLEKFDCNLLYHRLDGEKEYQTIIDIDPFGTPNRFIESAFSALLPGGLLAVTATDTAVIFGVRRDACYRKYNIRSLHTTFLKEVGIRIILYFIASRAHPLNMYIEPYASFSSDHFIRVFVRVYRGQEGPAKNLKESGYILWCEHCDWRSTIPLDLSGFTQNCPYCGQKTDFGGPLWLGKLHDVSFLQRIMTILNETPPSSLPSKNRLLKMLNRMQEEDQFPVGFYDIHKFSDLINASVPGMDVMIQKITERGFRACRTHFEDHGLKSDAPIEVITEILREFVLPK
jgi:tRNA (guanine26-N2/guanine27-N2)-dimethyltransferase